MQAKETTTPSQEVVDLLLMELKKDRITDIKDITHKRIKGYLKKLRLNKQYEHTPALISKLCGLPPPTISFPNLIDFKSVLRSTNPIYYLGRWFMYLLSSLIEAAN